MGTKRKITISIAVASFMMLFSYFITNMDWPISGEQQVMSICNQLKGNKVKSLNDSVLFIDVSYDLELTEKISRPGDTIGNTVVADRGKLYELLHYFDSVKTPSMILLDVFFEKGLRTPSDDKLFSLIQSMPNVFVPYVGTKDTLENKRLHSRAFPAVYFPTFLQAGFVKYPYLVNNITSLPLSMYECQYGGKLNNYYLFYTDKCHLARKSVVLQIESNLVNSDVFYLGNTIGVMSVFKYEPQLAFRKYIVIGHFAEGDMHITYKDNEISGTMILFNAYLALLHGQHILSYWVGILLFMMFFVYTYLILSRRTLYDIVSASLKPTKKWAKSIRASLLFICYWLGFPACLTVLCILTYFAEGKTYDILITSVIIQFFKIIIDIYYKRIEVKL